MNLIKDILNDSILFDTNIISDIIYTKDNPTTIESIDIKKIDSRVVKLSNKQVFNLKKFNCHKDEVKDLLFSELLSIVKSTQESISINFHPKGIFRFFKKRNQNELINNISNYSWILANNNILNLIPKTLQTLKDDTLENEVYVGSTESIGVIINQNYKIKDDNTIEFELLIYNKNTKKIILE